MIPASLYHTIYLFVVSIISIAIYMKYQNRNGGLYYSHRSTDLFAFVLMLTMVLFIGLRPVSGKYFVDMVNYVNYYLAVLEGSTFYFEPNTENIIFDNLFVLNIVI